MNDQENKLAILEWAKGFRDDAIADGWNIEKTYENESVDSASTLTKNGFKMLVITRNHQSPVIRTQRVIQGSVNIFGPDGLAIESPVKYSWELIEKGLHKCCFCKADGKKTVKVGFTNRVCEDCLPKAKKKFETPGWYN
jgi:hypothetical protein